MSGSESEIVSSEYTPWSIPSDNLLTLVPAVYADSQEVKAEKEPPLALYLYRTWSVVVSNSIFMMYHVAVERPVARLVHPVFLRYWSVEAPDFHFTQAEYFEPEASRWLNIKNPSPAPALVSTRVAKYTLPVVIPVIVR